MFTSLDSRRGCYRPTRLIQKRRLTSHASINVRRSYWTVRETGFSYGVILSVVEDTPKHLKAGSETKEKRPARKFQARCSFLKKVGDKFEVSIVFPKPYKLKFLCHRAKRNPVKRAECEETLIKKNICTMHQGSNLQDSYFLWKSHRGPDGEVPQLLNWSPGLPRL